ncbi:MAG: hydroxymethylbilane synthase [Alphaproteobacteria bacterium]|nr:hydroxymethylbilane synthase [Alphaproteobacteria bacterium]
MSTVPSTPAARAAAGALVIATRGSPLALVQAGLVRDALIAAHPGLAVSTAVIRTSGDMRLDRPLAEIGGKGLFTKEIEDALLDGRADIAVHSMKDVPTALPPGLHIPCVMEREDVRDVLIARDPAVRRIDDLPRGARIGTASLRRAAQALARRPDLRIVALRGNVGTRIDKIAAGAADATFLALAGLKRLGISDDTGTILDVDDMLPAVAQGAIGVECRSDDARVARLLEHLDHAPSRRCVTAERALLAALEGSCRTPIAALATVTGPDGADASLDLRAMIALPDGRRRVDARQSGTDAAALGAAVGARLRADAGPEFFVALASASPSGAGR